MGISILRVLLGAIELLMGRRLFWLIAGIMGFLVGLFVTVNYLQFDAWINVLIGLAVGVIFAGLARLIPKTVIALLGFAAFGIAAVTIGARFGLERGSVLYWVIFLLIGLFGASLAFWLFEWALILGSSMIGASSILSGFDEIIHIPGEGIFWTILFIVLFVIGVSFQARELHKKH